MIRITAITEINGNGDNVRYPERQLTPEELATVIGQHGDENDYIYFQVGDEETAQYLLFKELSSQPIEPGESPAMIAWKMASPEEKQAMANDLKNYL